jgi:cytochrome c oxidase subunit III
MTARALDVSHLKTYALGSRDPMWWAVISMIVIESTAFALLLGTYFYMKDQAHLWPTQPLGREVMTLGLANVGVLLLSVVPTAIAQRGARQERLKPMQWGLLGASVLTLVSVVLRWFEFRALPFRWDSSAYGSAVWMIYGLHAFHLCTAFVENAVVAALLFIGPVEKKHLTDVDVSSLYFYFVVVSWLPLVVVVLLDGWRPG